MQGPLTPYVTAGVGWSFIDTNIPDAPPQNFCGWDRRYALLWPRRSHDRIDMAGVVGVSPGERG